MPEKMCDAILNIVFMFMLSFLLVRDGVLLWNDPIVISLSIIFFIASTYSANQKAEGI